MASPFIFESVTIADSTGANPLTYNLVDVENSKVTVDFNTSEVDASQLLGSSRLVDFSIMLYDQDILSDTRLMQSGATLKNPAQITLNPAGGATGLVVSNVRMILKRTISDMTCFYITGKKRGILQANIMDYWASSLQVWGTSQTVWDSSYTQGNLLQII